MGGPITRTLSPTGQKTGAINLMNLSNVTNPTSEPESNRPTQGDIEQSCETTLSNEHLESIALQALGERGGIQVGVEATTTAKPPSANIPTSSHDSTPERLRIASLSP